MNDGSFDTSFGSAGKAYADVSGGQDIIYAIAIQPDGKIVAAGADPKKFALARYNKDGSLDSTFDNDGVVTTQVASPYSNARAVSVLADGKIVAAGSCGSGDFAVVRYNPDGSLDSSFGTQSLVQTPVLSSYDYGNAMAVPWIQLLVMWEG